MPKNVKYIWLRITIHMLAITLVHLKKKLNIIVSVLALVCIHPLYQSQFEGISV